MDKRTIARFVSFVVECELGKIEATNHYKIDNFKRDLINLYAKSDVDDKRLALILSDIYRKFYDRKFNMEL